MGTDRRVLRLFAVALISIGWGGGLSRAQGAADDTLAAAVAAMRGIDCSRSPSPCDDKKAKELDAAWKTLQAAGPKGAAALKTEIASLDASRQRDDFFKLGAAAVLWRIGGVGEAEDVARIWSSDVDFAVNYQYVFFTAIDAARTEDPRALPILTAILRDQKGRVTLPQHAMTLDWPLTHQFVWGRMGARGTDALARLLAESKDQTTRASAIALLARENDLAALPQIRALAHEGDGVLRVEAIKALGVFGHPQDFADLAAGLKGVPDVAYASAYALYEYGDLRAVPLLIPLLSTPDVRLGREVVGALFGLTTPAGLEALDKCRGRADVSRETVQLCGQAFGALLDRLQLDPKQFGLASADLKGQSIKRYLTGVEDEFRLKTGDRRLTHDDLLLAAAEWKTTHRITGGKYAWVEDRHLLAAATADDIPLLLDVAAACFDRVSDEGLGEAGRIYGVIARIGRARYRAEVGVTDQVRGPGIR